MKALYLLNPYEKEFSSKVKSANGKFVVLEETAFYPNSGGQPNDTGKLITPDGTAYNVVFVGKFEGEISHEVDKEGLKEGDEVKGFIDWERRYKLMRYHTAAHILSTLISRDTGAEITGNQLGLDKSRVDFSLEHFDRELMNSYESKVNEIIDKGYPIKFKIAPKEEAFRIPDILKLKKAFDESIKEIRLVEIEGFDVQACGGCHVRNTSEIGHIEITKLDNRGAGRKRVYFVLK